MLSNLTHLFFVGMTPCLWVVISIWLKTTTLSWNIRNQLPSDVASYPRRIGVSPTLLWKPTNSVSFYFVIWFFLDNETKWDFYVVSVLNSRTIGPVLPPLNCHACFTQFYVCIRIYHSQIENIEAIAEWTYQN
jgi:hypothetical protein